MATKKQKAKKLSTKLNGGVHISASLSRESAPPEASGYYSSLAKLYVDAKGHLIGEARCGEQAFVCAKSEIKQLVKFLEEVTAA
jgi:hypothetical protein